MVAILKEAGAPHDEGTSDGRIWLQWSDKVWRHEWSKGGGIKCEQRFRRAVRKRLDWEAERRGLMPPVVRPRGLVLPAEPVAPDPASPEAHPTETGGELAVAPTPRDPIRLPNGQLIGQPGSNGGVHRGPDKFPRRNAIRAIFLHAIAQEQERQHVDPSTGELEVDAAGKPIKRKMKMAMVQDIVMAYTLIARNAAEGKGIDQFLRMMADAHNMLQPEKDEAGQGRTPIPGRFVLAQDVPEPQPEGDGGERPSASGPAAAPRAQAPAQPAIPSGAIVTADGKVYE